MALAARLEFLGFSCHRSNSGTRGEYFARCSERHYPSGDYYAHTRDVFAPPVNIADMYANANFELFLFECVTKFVGSTDRVRR